MSRFGVDSSSRNFAGGGPVVELHADFFERPQREVAQQQRGQQRGSQGEAGEGKRFAEPGRIGLAQQSGARADMDGGEGLAVAIEGHDNIKNLGGTEDILYELDRVGVEELLVVGYGRGAACLRCRDWC